MIPPTISTTFHSALSDHLELFNKIQNDKPLQKEIERAATIVLESILNGGAIYLCGNGGSAADAQHIATEFVSRFYKERKAINAEALTVNTSSLTAIANDYSFDRIFARQLEAKGKSGDVLIGISTSGTSPDVIKALDYAKSCDIRTILMTGNKIISDEYDSVIRIPSEDTPRIQETHIFVGHAIAEYVEDHFVT